MGNLFDLFDGEERKPLAGAFDGPTGSETSEEVESWDSMSSYIDLDGGSWNQLSTTA